MTAVKPPGPSPEVPAGLSDPQKTDFAKLRYAQDLEAWMEQWKQDTSLNASRADADQAMEDSLVKSVHDAYLKTTQDSLDRALTRVNVLTASISAVITIYTGLLALVFAAEPGKGQPLSASAIIPAIFLGLALFLTTVYAALFRKTVTAGPLLPTGIGGQLAEMRLIVFMRWCFAGVLARAWALHAGIVSLGWGVATLPLPFVHLKGWQQILVLVVGLAVVATALGVTKLRDKPEAGAAVPSPPAADGSAG